MGGKNDGKGVILNGELNPFIFSSEFLELVDVGVLVSSTGGNPVEETFSSATLLELEACERIVAVDRAFEEDAEEPETEE